MGDFPISIAVEQLASLRREGTAHAVLDVREPWELDICRLRDSLTIPLMQIPDRVGELPADLPLIVVCHHGMRSLQAVNWLRRAGFANAINLEGGIDAWARAIEPSMGVY